MKIAFDLRRIKNPGIGRYMRCLAEQIISSAPDNNYLLIMPQDCPDAVRAEGPNITRICPELRYYSVREQIELPRILTREKVDLLHSPHFNLPLFGACPSIVTIHDVIYLACPEDLPSPIGRLYYRAMMSASVKLADRIITDSEYSRSDIIRLLRGDSEKIEVIYPGVEQSFAPVLEESVIRATQQRYGIRGDYIIYTGIYKKRKNHSGLLRAFRTLINRGVDAQLVIAGPLEDGAGRLRREASELGIENHLVLTGFVAEGELPVLYSGAHAYACASTYEGFGFTVLEAMACGTPVVCSRLTSLPEVAGDAAVYADTRNAEEFAEVLYRLLKDAGLRAECRERGFANVLRFQWHTAAARTLSVYHQVLGLRQGTPVCV